MTLASRVRAPVPQHRQRLNAIAMYFVVFALLQSIQAQTVSDECHPNAENWGDVGLTYAIDASAMQYEKEIDAAADAWNKIRPYFRKTNSSPNVIRAAPGDNRVFIIARALFGRTPDGTTEQIFLTRGNAKTVLSQETYLNLSVGLSTGTPITGQDVQVIMLHEFGHWLGFKDVHPQLREQDASKRDVCKTKTIMWHELVLDVKRRNPLPDDVTAFQRLHPLPKTPANQGSRIRPQGSSNASGGSRTATPTKGEVPAKAQDPRGKR